MIDARPDASRRARVIARGRVRGRLIQSADADRRDRHADAAVEQVIAKGLFRRTGERGFLWHGATFADLAQLDDYLTETSRYSRYEGRTRSALLPFRSGPIRMRRAIKFEVLERL